MGKRVYLLQKGMPKEYLCHAHGIATFCHTHEIGELDFNYPCISRKDIANFGIKKDGLTEMLFEGEMTAKRIDGELIYSTTMPVSAILILTKSDIEKFKPFIEKGNYQSKVLQKMTEQHEIRQLDEYRLLVEINSQPF